MTDTTRGDEPGSDELMSDKQRTRVAEQADHDAAAAAAEDQLTAQQPIDGPG